MNRAWAVLVVAAFGGLLAVSARAQDAAKIEKGKQVYDAATPKCKVCH